MGANNGTGNPIFFRCAIARRGRRDYRSHAVELTGRTKARSRRGGIRMSNVMREYRCDCGHVGWSAHKDLERRALAK